MKTSFICIHHASKGNQSDKATTDVGAGAGAQSRAVDTHLVLRPHEEDDAIVLDAAVRSWPPVQSRALRWTFPVWNPAGDIGPSLTGVGTKYDRQFLIESILYPSKQILDGYQQTIIRMKDGDAQSGVVKVETDTEVTLFDAAAQKIVIKKTDIKEREPSKLSLMPEGLHTSLKPEEFSDLVAYLESLKETPKK